MAERVFTVVNLLFCCAALSTATNPGLTLRISQSGLNYAASMAIQELASDVKGQSIPDQHGKEHVAIGKIDYDITGMRVSSFTSPTSSVVVHPGKGITWSLSNAGVSVHGDWRYKYRKAFIHISDHGNFDVTVSGVSMTVGLAMGVDANGRPTLSMTSCSCNVGSVHVKFHGGASWLYNFFDHTISKPIEKKLKSVLCDSVKKAIVKGNTHLSKMKVRVPLESLLVLDYRLVAAPVFGNNYIESQHKGEFFWAMNQTEAPFPANPIGQPQGAQKMVTICMSDYVTDTLGYAIDTYGHKYLKYTLTKKDLPEDARHFLNSSTIPPLAKKYPKGSIEISLAVTAPPSLKTTKSVIFGTFRGETEFNVRLPNGSVGKGFSGSVLARVVLSVKMVGERVTARVKQMKFFTNITKSEVGPIPDMILNLIFDAAAKGFIIPQLNKLGGKGFNLPTIDHAQFVNPELQQMAGAMCFTTDAKYDPKLRGPLRFKPLSRDRIENALHHYNV